MGGQPILKYHYSQRRFTYSVKYSPRAERCGVLVRSLGRFAGPGDVRRRHRQVGSLAGAAHLLNDNTGVLRLAQ